MKPRHAAALALVGWYLTVPPVVCEKGRCTTQLDAPFSQWHRSKKSVDSESACEQARPKVRAAVDKAIQDVSARPEYDKALAAAEYDKALAAGLCVSSDDPRLKPN
jgi:hypothetical protein